MFNFKKGGPRRASRGSILVVTVCTTAIIGLAVLVYVRLASNQHHMTMRSQVWNCTLTVVEAGIEEALTHCTRNFQTNMESGGWQLQGNQFVKENNIGDGRYRVAISQTIPYEMIATGYLPAPLGGAEISRRVRVATENRGVFAGAMIVKSFVELNGNNVKTDSFHSGNTNKSTNGRYDPLKAGDKGDIACTTGLRDAVDLGNANVWGKVFTGPGAEIDMGPNGAVGSVAWQRAGWRGIEPGWTDDDFNVAFPDVTPPFASGAGLPPDSGGSIGGVVYDTVLSSANYEVANWGGKVRVVGHAVLWVHGEISFSGEDDRLDIAPGASLKVYCSGASTVFGKILNENSPAASFLYYGLPSNRTLEFKGGGHTTGGFYAPSADFVLAGGTEISGAIIGNSCRMTGHSQIHYDEALKLELPVIAFVVNRWDEL